MIATKVYEVTNAKTVLFLDCSLQSISGIKNDWYAELTGWLSIKEVGAVGGKVLDPQGLILDCGGIIAEKGIRPLFQGYSSYYSGLLGNTEWVRNLLWVSTQMFAVKKEVFKKLEFSSSTTSGHGVAQLFFQISK